MQCAINIIKVFVTDLYQTKSITAKICMLPLHAFISKSSIAFSTYSTISKMSFCYLHESGLRHRWALYSMMRKGNFNKNILSSCDITGFIRILLKNALLYRSINTPNSACSCRSLEKQGVKYECRSISFICLSCVVE